MNNTIKKTSVLLTMTLFIAGCSSTTVMHSRPEGAKLYMNGMFVGKTPYVYKDTKIVGSATSVELKMDGYENLSTQISKDEKPDVGAIVGGVFFLFPFLWTMEYQPEHTYELVPASSHVDKQ